MKLKLCYLTPGETEPVDTERYRTLDNVNASWLHSMVELNPETNFFYVTETTDIFEDEVNEPRSISLLFDPSNPNWTSVPAINLLFLRGVQQHMNNLLYTRGHVFLNDVFDALGAPRTSVGAVVGWLNNDDGRDGYVDFGLFNEGEEATAFRNGEVNEINLCFNVDGYMWSSI